ncbi:succinate dehydrogenase assembly factor 2 [archaeon]|nr:MAG: succinate dehydrogenase assembly factor 2 [archaeon]
MSALRLLVRSSSVVAGRNAWQGKCRQPFVRLNSSLNQDQAEKIASRNYQLRNDYEEIRLRPGDSLDEVRRKRLIYRSKQRGWLEVDILLGSWAAKNVPHLTTEQMDDYEMILREETIDIFNYISGKDALPEHLKDSKMVKVLQDYAYSSGVISPEKYKEIKTSTNLI